MSNEKSVVENSAAATTQDPGNTPESVVADLRAIRARIPEYIQLPVSNRRVLTTVAHVHADFTQAAIGAIGTSTTVSGVVGSTSDELQVDVDAAGRWAVVEDELRAMLKGVEASNLTRRNNIGEKALLAYVVSKRLVRKPEHADLLPHVEVMKQMNRFGRKNRKAAKQPIPVTPSTESPSSTPKV